MSNKVPFFTSMLKGVLSVLPHLLLPLFILGSVWHLWLHGCQPVCPLHIWWGCSGKRKHWEAYPPGPRCTSQRTHPNPGQEPGRQLSCMLTIQYNTEKCKLCLAWSSPMLVSWTFWNATVTVSFTEKLMNEMCFCVYRAWLWVWVTRSICLRRSPCLRGEAHRWHKWQLVQCLPTLLRLTSLFPL